jgi:hypothetical protein
MSEILSQLYPGSYNGVSFLIEDSNICGGRKTVVHEFPNQDNRYVEDLGLMNETIRIKASIPTAVYFSNRDALKNALETPNYGTLIHPFYGIRICAVESYDINEDTGNLGHVCINMTFKVAQPLNFPAGGSLSSSSVYIAVGNLFAARDSFYQLAYPATPKFGRSITHVSDAFRRFSAVVEATSLTYTTRTEFQSDATADFVKFHKSFDSKVGLYPLDRASFIREASVLINSIDLITSTGEAGFSIAASLFSYALADLVTKPQTIQQVSVEVSQDLIEAYIKVSAFGLMVQNASVLDYRTAEQYQVIRTTIGNAYSTLKNLITAIGDTTSSSNVSGFLRNDPTRRDVTSISTATSELLEVLEETNSVVSVYLAQIGADLPFLTQIDGRTLPLTVLTYLYYGKLDLVDFLQTANFPAQIDPAYLTGPVNILSGIFEKDR